MGDWYNGGTIAVESGSASIVGTTTLFATKIKEGDTLLTLQSDTLRLNQVTAIADDNNATIDPVWAGDTATGLAYYVIPTSRLWGEVSTAARDLSNFLANIATFFPTDGKPADDEGGDGSFAIDPNSTPPKLYVKTSGTWDDGTSLGGPTGATGKGYGGTSSDSKTLANTGSMSFTTQSGLAWQSGSRIRIASATAPTTKWMEGVVTSYSSTTLVVTIDKQGSGSGSASDWTFGAAGIPGEKGDTGATGSTGSTGATGAAGAGYGATSTTSRAIAATGSMTWTIGTGKAYQIGDLVKCVVSTDTTKWMKGVVSDYSSGVLTVAINEKNGTGTFASWNIGLAGETGATGATGDTGATGAAGADGADGSVLSATSATSLTTATGSKVFTLDAVADFVVGQRLRAASASDVTNWMSGLVTAFTTSPLELTLNVDQIGPGADTASDWNIALTGEKGDQGPAGGFGSLSAAKGTLPVGDGTTFGAMAIGADGTVPIADSTKTFGFAWLAEDAINAGPYWTSSDVASAATCDIGAATTPFVRITGTTAITSFGTQPNRIRFVRFAGSLVLTYNGTSLVLPGTSNIVTAAGDVGIFASDDSGKWRCISWTPVGSRPRETLTASRTYYVRTDGSDSNNGLANTSAGAFLTLQKAINVVAALDLSIFNASIQVGAGTYTAGINVTGPFIGSGAVSIVGDTTTPSNVVISPSSGRAIIANNGAVFNLAGFKITTTNAEAILARGGSLVTLNGKMDFGSVGSGFHMNADQFGRISIATDYTISGGAVAHVLANSGLVTVSLSRTITLSGTPAFTRFVNATRLGIAILAPLTFSGSATGSRYTIDSGGLIYTGGGGASYFPGDSAGSGGTTTGGGYYS